jgi:hypothetical protein
MVRPFSRAAEKTAQQVAVVLMDDNRLITDTPAFFLKMYYDVHIAETRADAREKPMAMEHKSECALIDPDLHLSMHQLEEGFVLNQPLREHYLILQEVEIKKVNH